VCGLRFERLLCLVGLDKQIKSIFQKIFWGMEWIDLSLQTCLEIAKQPDPRQPAEVKADPDEKVIVKDGCVIRAVPPRPRSASVGDGGPMRGGRGRGRPPFRGGGRGRGFGVIF
jgi:hypothetical protein